MPSYERASKLIQFLFHSQYKVHLSVTFQPPAWAEHHNSNATESAKVEEKSSVIINKSLAHRVPNFLKDLSK